MYIVSVRDMSITYLKRALPASTIIQSRAKSICRTKGVSRFMVVEATFSTTDGCSRIILVTYNTDVAMLLYTTTLPFSLIIS